VADQAHILISQIDEKGVPSGSTLHLSGRAMPYRGLEFERNTAAEFTWYPGNPVATTQLLGSKMKPTTLNGMWKDRFIKSVTDDNVAVMPEGIALFNGQQIASVLDLVEAVDQMQLEGLPVRFEWGAIVRVGTFMRFKQKWERFEDLEWEMEFQWTGTGAPQSPVTVPLMPSALSFAAQMQNLSDILHAAIHPPAFQVADDFLRTVNTAVALVDDAGKDMTAAVSNATRLISAPADASARALAAAESIKDAAASIVTAVEGTAPLDVIKSSSPSLLTLGDSLQADNYARGIKQASRALQAFAASAGDDLRASLNQDTLLAAFVARGPMDLRDVSQRYYNTPDEWRRLLSYNARSSSRLSAGDLILVPKLSGSDTRA
jgi:hypothetical protein